MNLDFNQLQQFIGQAKRQYEELRQKMAGISVEASAGGGMVTVRMDGNKQVLEVRLDPDVVKNDPDMLPDLIRAAVNEAGRRIDQMLQSELGSMAGGLNLPGLV